MPCVPIGLSWSAHLRSRGIGIRAWPRFGIGARIYSFSFGIAKKGAYIDLTPNEKLQLTAYCGTKA